MQFFLLNAETSVDSSKKTDANAPSTEFDVGFSALFDDELAVQVSDLKNESSAKSLKGQEVAAIAKHSANHSAKFTETGIDDQTMMPAMMAKTATENLSQSQPALPAQTSTPGLTLSQPLAEALLPANSHLDTVELTVPTADSPWLQLIANAEQYSAQIVVMEQRPVVNLQSTSVTQALLNSTQAQEQQTGTIDGLQSAPTDISLSLSTAVTAATQPEAKLDTSTSHHQIAASHSDALADVMLTATAPAATDLETLDSSSPQSTFVATASAVQLPAKNSAEEPTGDKTSVELQQQSLSEKITTAQAQIDTVHGDVPDDSHVAPAPLFTAVFSAAAETRQTSMTTEQQTALVTAADRESGSQTLTVASNLAPTDTASNVVTDMNTDVDGKASSGLDSMPSASQRPSLLKAESQLPVNTPAALEASLQAVMLNNEGQNPMAVSSQNLGNTAPQTFAEHQKSVNAADAFAQKQQLKAEFATAAEPQQGQQQQQQSRQDSHAASAATMVSESPNQPILSGGFDKTLTAATLPHGQGASIAAQPLSSHASQMAAVKTAEAQLSPIFLQDPQAAVQLKDKVMYQVQQKIQTAEIRLAPEELGAVQIKVNLQQDQLSLQFVVQQPQAKEALEQQMPRLKELLQQQGMELTDSQVSQEQQRQGEKQQRASGQSRLGNELTDEPLPQQAAIRRSDRVVDYYA